jgi:hypothetical protein
MAAYGREPFEAAMRWRVAFVNGPWDGKSGRYYGLEGFPDMPVANGRDRTGRDGQSQHRA